MNTPPSASYIICATPRTGSTLLCALLESSGVAGKPQSYFRSQDNDLFLWAKRWGLVDSPEDNLKFSDYLKAAIRAGTSENGVFAARIMWGTMEEVVEHLGGIFPDIPDRDLALLTRAFGPTHFIYLQRRNVVAQAVSLLRADQTNVWHIVEGTRNEQPKKEPHYDFDRIRGFVQEINEHNDAWQEWFRSIGVKPCCVWYEDLDTDPVGITRGVLHFLKLKVPSGRMINAGNRRTADKLNAEWIERYYADSDASITT